jgi:hypothetical protein
MFLDNGRDQSPDSVFRRTSRYIIALRDHLERLTLHGIGVDVDAHKDGARIVALTYGDKQFLLRNKVKVDVKVKPKMTGDALITHESGK